MTFTDNVVGDDGRCFREAWIFSFLRRNHDPVSSIDWTGLVFRFSVFFEG